MPASNAYRGDAAIGSLSIGHAAHEHDNGKGSLCGPFLLCTGNDQFYIEGAQAGTRAAKALTCPFPVCNIFIILEGPAKACKQNTPRNAWWWVPGDEAALFAKWSDYRGHSS